MAEKKFKLVENRIVGFSGYKRSGKGTCAEALKGMRYVDVPFAGGLKAMLTAWLEYNDVEDPSLYTDDWYKDHRSRYFNNKEFRYAMQTLGTEWGRNFMGKNFWIDGWKRKIKNLDRVAVSDVRFPDEVDAIREQNGIVIKVRRPSFYNMDEHVSEANMESLKCDYEVVNIEIEDTKKQVREIVKNHFKGKGNFIRD
jgi:hypothetical protein